jgi:16S rRNA (guanine527-N7)-methyltransferase
MKELNQSLQSMLGLRLSGAQLAALQIYEKELLEWNTRINLTAIRKPEEIRTKHFLDSLSCLCVMRDISIDRVIDIGTGAGFPGLPLRIYYPSMRLTLVDSVGKKAEFCRHIVKTLGLEGVEIIQERAESVGHMLAHRQQYDWALARAVADLRVLAEYLLPFLRVGGAMIAMKGESAYAEAHATEHAVQVLGGHLRRVIPLQLPGVVEERYLVVIDKVAATPSGYPRRVGVPAKHPL